MNFYIHNRYTAVRWSYDYRDSTIAIISIIDPGTEINDFHNNVPEDSILRLHFWDRDSATDGSKLFTIEDAKQILEFTEKYIDSVDFFIVHCGAGISRSSGCAAALSKIYNQTDEDIFTNPEYIPNMLVYRTILEEYMLGDYNV